MCSIVGYYAKNPSIDLQSRYLVPLINQSKIRGLHAFGMAHYDDNLGEVIVHKYDFVHSLIGKIGNTLISDGMFHSRYCTSGDWHDPANNQPISLSEYSLVFNGVISMKTKAEMEKEYHMKLKTENDGEIFLRKLADGIDVVDFIMEIPGSFAGLWYNNGVLCAARNPRRPMWYTKLDDIVIFASTYDILLRTHKDLADSAKECVPGELYVLQEMV